MRKLIVVAGTVCLLTVGLIFGQRLLANPVPSPAPGVPQAAPAQGTRPTISWSVPQLSQIMFPGMSSTVVLSFRSDQNLPNALVDITPSLNGIVSANPTSFAAITAGQSNQITVTLTAPPEFIQRDFGGTIHIRNAGSPPKTYDTPLPVDLQTGWNTATFTSGGRNIVVAVPVDWLVRATATEIDVSSPALRSLDASQDAEVPPEDLLIRLFPKPASQPIAQFASQFDKSLVAYATTFTMNVSGHNAIVYSDTISPVPHQPVLVALVDDPTQNQAVVMTLLQIAPGNLQPLFLQLLAGLKLP